eukprot:1179802-Prorocentrum_minimum.AAC.3
MTSPKAPNVVSDGIEAIYIFALLDASREGTMCISRGEPPAVSPSRHLISGVAPEALGGRGG